MKKLALYIVLQFVAIAVMAQSKPEQDRQAIRALAGFYKVTFNYAETFAPDTAYKFHPRYSSWGYEWAVIVEDSPKKIVIQHLLAIDSMVIKHWREDWVYEQPTYLSYDKDNVWKKTILKPNDVKGTWVQSVYQVDDSPRYQSIGTWMHVDGRHQWQSEADSPLPRREFTKRSDYNVLRRGNRVYLTPDGWMFEQDNKKIARGTGGDKLLAQEKGYEEFTRADEAQFTFAKKYWAEQKSYWADVRQVWEGIFAKANAFKLNQKVDGKLLFERLFELGDQSVKEKWNSARNREEAAKVIKMHVVVS